MKIKNYTFENNYIRVQADKLSFEKAGIYYIHGENGVGKTSIIQQIIFGINQNVEMNTKEQQDAYDQNRSGLFAYVPQDIVIPSRVRISEYVLKNNKTIDRNQYESYLKLFQLTDIKQNAFVSDLSGGERTKLCIISAFLKKTPYIILDEPTNNLDDKSVQQLLKLIREKSSQCTIVIISHDQRVVLEEAIEVEVRTDGTIVQTGSCRDAEENCEPPNTTIKQNHIRIGASLQKSLPNAFIRVWVLILFATIILFNLEEFSMHYAFGTKANPEHILIYHVDHVYGDLNKMFTKGAGIKVEPDRFYSMVKYSDIPAIAGREGIDSLLLLDAEKLEECFESAVNMKMKPFSVPSLVYNDFIDTVGISEFLALTKGRAPKDGSNEICLSERILESLNASKTVGQKIVFEGKEYVLSGICVNDSVWVAYEGTNDDNSLFYNYVSDTYSAFSEKNVAFQQKNEALFPEYPDSIIITCKSGYEQKVLFSLVSEFPADNYFSSVYDQCWVRAFNSGFVLKMILINGVFLIAISFLWLWITKRTIEDDYRKIKDYQNYYILGNKLNRIYILFYSLFSILGFVIESIGFWLMSGEYEMCDTCLLLILADMILFLIVQFLLLVKINPLTKQNAGKLEKDVLTNSSNKTLNRKIPEL